MTDLTRPFIECCPGYWRKFSLADLKGVAISDDRHQFIIVEEEGGGKKCVNFDGYVPDTAKHAPKHSKLLELFAWARMTRAADYPYPRVTIECPKCNRACNYAFGRIVPLVRPDSVSDTVRRKGEARRYLQLKMRIFDTSQAGRD
ncbi:MAG: hypothetical protein P8Z76_19895 [Alphaproteobacteria bacterium]